MAACARPGALRRARRRRGASQGDGRKRACCPRSRGGLGVAGAHLLIADAAASAVETAERKARGGEANRVPRWIVILEGWGDEAPFDALCRAALSDDVLRAHGAAGPAAFGLYRHQVTRTKTPWTAG